MHWSLTIPSRKMAVHKLLRYFFVALHEICSREDREFYQAKTVETHNNFTSKTRGGLGMRLLEWQFLTIYLTLGRMMTSHSIRKLHIFAVPITWSNYNHGVIPDEVKNTAVVYKTACKLNTLNKNFDFAPIWYVFAFSTSWLHSALLVQQTCLLQNKGSPVVLQHPCTVSVSTQSTATHGPMFFPHASNCDNTQGYAHTLCPLTHRHLPQRLLSPQWSLQTVILAGSDPHGHRSSSAQLLSFSRGDLRSWRPLLSWRLTHLSFGIVCTLADLTLFCRSSLLSTPLVYLVVWWIKISVG